ncbi:hypothetical protein M9458_048200, partial [Cirrhinus mrigala]
EGVERHLSPYHLSSRAHGGDGEANGCWVTKPSSLGRDLRYCRSQPENLQRCSPEVQSRAAAAVWAWQWL